MGVLLAGSARLVLSNGLVFKGSSIGIDGTIVSELVFNTAMTGYQEILTDPSYAGQIVTFTHPHIGNTGINSEDMESRRVWLSGLVIRELARYVSNYRSEQSLGEFLQAEQVIAIAEIDTRAITNLLRTEGALGAALLAGPKVAAVSDDEAIAMAKGFAGLQGVDLTKDVAIEVPTDWTQGCWAWEDGFHDEALSAVAFHVVVLDFGVKQNILRMLKGQGCKVSLVPGESSVDAILEQQPDGILLSNGPGDPAACVDVIERVKQLLNTGIPMFGICLGHQILALACGAQTEKMKFGHHGANHPIKDLVTGQVLISSQNHSFTVSDSGLDDFEITHRSLFDGTVQGLAHKQWPVFGFQGHPEASPGPHESGCIFDRFIHASRVHNADRNKQAQP